MELLSLDHVHLSVPDLARAEELRAAPAEFEPEHGMILELVERPH